MITVALRVPQARVGRVCAWAVECALWVPCTRVGRECAQAGGSAVRTGGPVPGGQVVRAGRVRRLEPVGRFQKGMRNKKSSCACHTARSLSDRMVSSFCVSLPVLVTLSFAIIIILIKKSQNTPQNGLFGGFRFFSHREHREHRELEILDFRSASF